MQQILEIQRAASHPETSVWVNASAGTGKTKVLTDRLLRLMLTGTEPEKILCLTFTKAAAAEMTNRLRDILGTWVVLKERELKEELERFLGFVPSSSLLHRARFLFTKTLDAPGGIKIQTIHSFCQSLLQKFPLEAGVSPHFKVMDDTQTLGLLKEAEELLLEKSLEEGSLSKLLNKIATLLDYTTFQNLLLTLTQNKAHFKSLFSTLSLEECLLCLSKNLNVSPGLTREAFLNKVFRDDSFEYEGLKNALPFLEGGSVTEQKKAQGIFKWLMEGDSLETKLKKRQETFSNYSSLFLTQDHEVRKTLLTKSLSLKYPDLAFCLQREGERLYEAQRTLKSLELIETSYLMISLAYEFLEIYEALKQEKSLLDYDDLISFSAELLHKPAIAPWILYKLDGGIHHILIDEAQDTSPNQWQVILALSEEFFLNAGGSPIQRTFFTVGDTKQSIYSFQGADPQVFDQVHRSLKATALKVQEKWQDISLSVSFRSTEAVLKVVDHLFKHPTVQKGVLFDKHPIHHESFRRGQGGCVELWPLLGVDSPEERQAWHVPLENKMQKGSRTLLAEAIAFKIQDWLKNKELLVSQGRPIEPGDIMILVRKRDAFVTEIVRLLKKLHIPVSGLDRMILTEQLAVMDLMAFGDCLLLPEDDLTLATVLKGPFFSMKEEDLFKIAYGRGELSLWASLKKQAEKTPFKEAVAFLEHFIELSALATPYEFYMQLLTKWEGKKKLLSRLGLDAKDPVEEFLNLCLTYEQTHLPSLQGLLHWLRSFEVEIKRDLDQGAKNEVRLLTIHGAKGLQAPIVFLPDTTQVPSIRSSLTWFKDTEDRLIPLWSPASYSSPVQQEIKAKGLFLEEEEYRRLLYVALTRAEDRLYICGWQSRREHPETCWYRLIEQSLRGMEGIQSAPFIIPGFDFAPAMPLLRYELPQTVAPTQKLTDRVPSPMTLTNLPDWINYSPCPEGLKTPFSYKKTATGNSPQEQEDLSSKEFREVASLRGTLIHKLLELIFPLSSSSRKEVCLQYLQNFAKDITSDEQESLVQEALRVAGAPHLSFLFEGKFYTEVPISGFIKGDLITGQIDLLSFNGSDLWVVDYKTGIPPKKDIPAVYQMQLETYQQLLKPLYPTYTLKPALLWTQTAVLRELEKI